MPEPGLFASLPARVCVRVYIDGALRRVEYASLDLDESKIQVMAERHVAMCGDRPYMIEIEFLDEPDQLQRFFRIGTDKQGMVVPIAMDLLTDYPD